MTLIHRLHEDPDGPINKLRPRPHGQNHIQSYQRIGQDYTVFEMFSHNAKLYHFTTGRHSSFIAYKQDHCFQLSVMDILPIQLDRHHSSTKSLSHEITILEASHASLLPRQDIMAAPNHSFDQRFYLTSCQHDTLVF